MQKSRPHWLAVSGKGEIGENSIRHVGIEPPKKKKDGDDKAPAELPSVTVRSDTYFQDGDITCEAFVERSDNKVQFRLGVDGSRVCYVGLNMRGHAYGIAYIDPAIGDGTIVSSLSGAGGSPVLGTWIPIHIRVRGSIVELFVSGVRVANCQASLIRAQLELVLYGLGTAEVRNIVVASIRPQTFVVMQFTDEYNQLYKEVVQPVCEEYGYEVIRADNVYTSGLIIEDIARSIREASIVIADITPNNANVYYEVGYAHGINKPTILLSDRKRDKLPFDISGFRLLFYDNTIGGKSEVDQALRKHLDAIRV